MTVCTVTRVTCGVLVSSSLTDRRPDRGPGCLPVAVQYSVAVRVPGSGWVTLNHIEPLPVFSRPRELRARERAGTGSGRDDSRLTREPLPRVRQAVRSYADTATGPQRRLAASRGSPHSAKPLRARPTMLHGHCCTKRVRLRARRGPARCPV